MQIEFTDGAVEVKKSAQAETVDCTLPVLAEEDLVRVGLEDLVLAVARVDDQRHQRLVDLAPHRTLGCQDEILDQLLGQRAAALHRTPGTQVGPHGARDATQVDAGMFEEAPVLDSQQTIDQVLRQIAATHQDAILVVRRVDAADQRRFEPHQVDRATGVGTDRLDRARTGRDDDRLGRFVAVPERERARVHDEAATIARPLCGPRGTAHLAIPEKTQLRLQLVRTDRRTGIQIERPRIDLCRHRPALALELDSHHARQVDRIGAEYQGRQDDEGENRPPQPPTRPRRAFRWSPRSPRAIGFPACHLD